TAIVKERSDFVSALSGAGRLPVVRGEPVFRILNHRMMRENKSEMEIRRESIERDLRVRRTSPARSTAILSSLPDRSLSRVLLITLADPEADIPALIRELSRTKSSLVGAGFSIDYAEPDYLYQAQAIPNDPGFGDLWGMHNTGQGGGTSGADIDALPAWDLETGSAEVVTAVIDTGVDYTHEDLASNMWTNPGEIPGNGIDDDDNGYIDDVYGIDACNDDSDPRDDRGHGTHCSGTIGGVGNNGIGVTGVCWKTRIMALKFLSSAGGGFDADAIRCIEYAVAMGARIMSNSWAGGKFNQSLYDAIAAARDAGILFVAAAANSGSNNDLKPVYPCSYDLDNIIAVAATDNRDELASFSCFGPRSVDLAAPGVGIMSTLPGNEYGSKNGTSMATPHTAGLCALIAARHPDWTGEEIKACLLNTAEEKPDLAGKILTGGRINAFWAIQNNQEAPALTVVSPEDRSLVKGMVTVRAEASDPDGIDRVEFFAGEIAIGTDRTAPYECAWDAIPYPDGAIFTLSAVAYDLRSRLTRKEIRVMIHNASTPGVWLYNPEEGSVVSGRITLQATASFDPGIASVAFLLAGEELGKDEGAPYELEWNSFETANGSYSLTARATGTDGEVAENTIEITVRNSHLPPEERSALIALYAATGGDGWRDRTNWKKENGEFNDPGTEYAWKGVTVATDRVTRIGLSDNNLKGILPPELGDFSALYYLDLSRNSLSGEIPEQLWSATGLKYLYLDDNDLIGGLSSSVSALTGLRTLYLFGNRLSGEIPSSLASLSQLSRLDLAMNGFVGTIPAGLGELDHLVYLNLR
ncbi:MAG: S8 family serine peptidase, partial [Candidatus Aureabacteria bacterium]|nr:S8 family serine peptidase [Candidatus Auribacterota bacterium]